MAEERINDLPKAECSKPPCPTDEEAAQAVAVTDAVLTAATKRDVAGVCEHASDTLLKLISDDPETPVSQAECAAWVPGNIDSYGNPPPPGGYTIPRIGFQQMGDGGTDRRWSAANSRSPIGRMIPPSRRYARRW